jgi:hypothetical protein
LNAVFFYDPTDLTADPIAAKVRCMRELERLLPGVPISLDMRADDRFVGRRPWLLLDGGK